jgi:hypothetical protein
MLSYIAKDLSKQTGGERVIMSSMVADLVRRHPSGFRLLAVAARRMDNPGEIRRAREARAVDGVVVFGVGITNWRGESYLSDLIIPLKLVVAERDWLGRMHINNQRCRGGRIPLVWGGGFGTTRTLVDMLYAGVFKMVSEYQVRAGKGAAKVGG